LRKTKYDEKNGIPIKANTLSLNF